MPFELSIVTPQGESYNGPVDSVVLPGSEGDFGVLPEHERFLSPLRIGAVEIVAPTEHFHAVIAEGFAEAFSMQLFHLHFGSKWKLVGAKKRRQPTEAKLAYSIIGYTENNNRFQI